MPKPHLKVMLILLAVVAFLFVGTFLLPSNYQTCQQSGYNHARECAQHHFGPFALIWVAKEIEKYNGLVTAIATAVMAIFTGTLWRSSANTAKLTEKTVDLAEKQFLMEGRQADLAEKQHGLQRLQYYATHRPRIKVRGVSGPIRKGATDIFRVVVANAGETPAHIISYGIQAFDHDGEVAVEIRLKPVAPFDDANLASGAGYVFDTELEEEWTEDPDDPSRDGPVFVLGIISYRDETEIVRHTAFAREVIGGGGGNFSQIYAEKEYED